MGRFGGLLAVAMTIGAAAPGCGPKAARGDGAGAEGGGAFVEGWRGWTKVNGDVVVSKGHGGGMFVVNLYVNAVGADAYRAKKGPYPVGTIVVKEHFTNKDGAAGDPGPLMSMEKKAPGYDAKNGDWEYTKAKPDGGIEMRGKTATCIDCHAVAEASNPAADYLYGVP